MSWVKVRGQVVHAVRVLKTNRHEWWRILILMFQLVMTDSSQDSRPSSARIIGESRQMYSHKEVKRETKNFLSHFNTRTSCTLFRLECSLECCDQIKRERERWGETSLSIHVVTLIPVIRKTRESIECLLCLHLKYLRVFLRILCSESFLFLTSLLSFISQTRNSLSCSCLNSEFLIISQSHSFTRHTFACVLKRMLYIPFFMTWCFWSNYLLNVVWTDARNITSILASSSFFIWLS